MLFELTEEEQRQITEIYRKYADQKALLNSKIDGSSGEDQEQLLNEYSELLREENRETEAFIDDCNKRHFAEIADNPKAILDNARDIVPRLIQQEYETTEHYNFFENLIRLKMAVKTKSGYLLSSVYAFQMIITELEHLHIAAFKDDKENSSSLHSVIVEEICKSRYTDQDNVKKLLNDIINETEKPYYSNFQKTLEFLRAKLTEKEHYAIRPQNYITTVDRVTNKLFKNELTIPPDEEDKDALYRVTLDSERYERGRKKGKKKKDEDRTVVWAGLDYRPLLDSGIITAMPILDDADQNVFDALISHIIAGNRALSYDMIYRAMTGKIYGKITVPDEAMKAIDEAFNKFEGRFRAEYNYIDENGNENTRKYDAPFVTFQRTTDSIKINGKIINGGIILPEDPKFEPPLLRWAKDNGNEISTKDITLLDVPGINNSYDKRYQQGFLIKMCLYRRIIKMQNQFVRLKNSQYELDEKQRIIKYDYIYNAIGLDAENITKDKQHDIKTKINKCLNYWKDKDKGLIQDYNHMKDKSTGKYYAVMIYFLPKPKDGNEKLN